MRRTEVWQGIRRMKFEEVCEAITGHVTASVRRRYGGVGVPLEVTAEAIEGIAYPGLGLSHLYSDATAKRPP